MGYRTLRCSSCGALICVVSMLTLNICPTRRKPTFTFFTRRPMSNFYTSLHYLIAGGSRSCNNSSGEAACAEVHPSKTFNMCCIYPSWYDVAPRCGVAHPQVCVGIHGGRGGIEARCSLSRYPRFEVLHLFAEEKGRFAYHTIPQGLTDALFLHCYCFCCRCCCCCSRRYDGGGGVCCCDCCRLLRLWVCRGIHIFLCEPTLFLYLSQLSFA